MSLIRHNATPRYADAVGHAGAVWCVEVPPSEDGDIRSQTSGLLKALERTLAEAGSGTDRLLMATIYLVDMADYDGLNEVWEAWLPPGCAPARACIEVAGLARPGWRVEIAVVAAAIAVV